MVSNIERLAAMYFGQPTASWDDVNEFLEHVAFEQLLYSPKEAVLHDEFDEVVALAMTLQKLGWEQNQSFRMALIAIDGYSPEYDTPSNLDHWLQSIELTY